MVSKVDDDLFKEMKSEEKIEKIMQILQTVKQKEEFDKKFDWGSKELVKSNPDGKVTVFKCIHKGENRYYAIKVYSDVLEFTERELNSIISIQSIYHSNIIAYEGLYTWQDEDQDNKQILCIAMEFCDMSLEQLFTQRKEQGIKFTDIELVWMLKQGMEVIKFLRNEHKTHVYNLKPQNIFINGQGIWKFSDFGMAKTADGSCSISAVKLNGTASAYLAPEYLHGLKNQAVEEEMSMEKCDVFSLGMVMLQAYCGLTEPEIESLAINSYSKNIAEVTKKVQEQLKKNHTNAYFVDLVKSMTQGKYDSRLKADEILKKMYAGKMQEK